MHEFLNALCFKINSKCNEESSPSRRNCSSISLVVNLLCLAFILLFYLLLCLFNQFCFICLYKRRHFLIFMFWREVSVAMLPNMFKQGVISQGVDTLIRALWFSCDTEQDWNQLVFPLSIRCQGKKNGAVQLEVGSDLLLYIFRSLQSIIRFDIWRISMRYTENIQVIFYSQSYKLRCFFAFYVYVVSKWPIEYYRLKVAFYLASQNQMIINGYKKNM